jgi:hypothetical protein
MRCNGGSAGAGCAAGELDRLEHRNAHQDERGRQRLRHEALEVAGHEQAAERAGSGAAHEPDRPRSARYAR